MPSNKKQHQVNTGEKTKAQDKYSKKYDSNNDNSDDSDNFHPIELQSIDNSNNNSSTSGDSDSDETLAQIPIDVPEVLDNVFRYLTPQALGRSACVSKFWQGVSDTHRNWIETAKKETNNNKNLKPQDAKKIYIQQIVKTARKIDSEKKGKIFGKTIPFFSNIIKKENDIELYQNAVEDGDINTVRFLLLKKRVDVNQRFGRFSQVFDTHHLYGDITPIHIAAMKGKLTLMKVLLEYGADITSEIRVTMGYEGGCVNYEQDLFRSANGDSKVLSLIMIAHAEKALGKEPLEKKDIDAAKNYLEKSFAHDPEITKEYVEKIREEYKGYQITYTDKCLDQLGLDEILNKTKESSNCIVS